MKVKIDKPARVNILSGEVEVTEQEYQRLMLLGFVAKKEERVIPEAVEVRETPEAPKKKKK